MVCLPFCVLVFRVCDGVFTTGLHTAVPGADVCRQCSEHERQAAASDDHSVQTVCCQHHAYLPWGLPDGECCLTCRSVMRC